MAPQKTTVEITDPELYDRADRAAQSEGKTIDEFTSDALRRELARQSFDRIKREAEARRRGMTDDDVERTVEKAVTEYRQGR